MELVKNSRGPKGKKQKIDGANETDKFQSGQSTKWKTTKRG